MTWVTQQEFRQSAVQGLGWQINVAFFQEIKENQVEFRDLLEEVVFRLSRPMQDEIRTAAESLWKLRDGLESYFALEEFYGYLRPGAAVLSEVRPALRLQAETLRGEHGPLYCQLLAAVEIAEQILYRERIDSECERDLAAAFAEFYRRWVAHEQAEAKLLLEWHNRELGEGD